MSATTFAELLASVCSQEELCHVTYLLGDETVVRAMSERDSVALTKLFGVGFTPYESVLREYHGVDFRNRPGKFEITKHGAVILSAPDDHLGTVGCNVVTRVISEAKTTLRSSYLGNSRYTEDPGAAIGLIKQGALKRAIPSIRQQYPAVSKALNALEKMPFVDSDDDSMEGRVRMGEYLDCVVTLFTWLRGCEKPPRYEDSGRPDNAVTIVDYVVGGASSGAVDGVLPGDGTEFSADEQAFVRLLVSAKRLAHARDEEGEYLVLPSRDVFELIGDNYRPPVAIPDLYGKLEQTPQHAIAPAPTPMSPQPGHSKAEADEYQRALELYREYCAVDINRYSDLRTAIRLGGFSAQAKALYSDISKARKAKLFDRICEDGPMAFSAVVKSVAERLGVEADDACAELVAIRLVSAKSSFKVDRNNIVTRR